MKQTMMILFAALFTISAFGNEGQEEAIRKVIKNFVKAGDQNDREALEKCLDENYRVVMNQLFGSETVAVVDRTTYLDKIESKEWGGDDRKITFQKITINGNTANVSVTLTGEKATFVSLMHLVQDKDGNWKLISDMPTIQK